MDAEGTSRLRYSLRTARLSLVLFDIDGTLLLSGGAGVRAMSRAFEQVFGIADAFAGIELGGRTDTFLLSRAIARAGVLDSPRNHRRFREAYLQVLSEEIHNPGSGRSEVMPGVQSLLEAAQQEPSLHLALLTGNYEPAAYLKLGHFGLRDFFGWGAFGEESEDRNDLGRVAMRRAAERAIPPAACSRAIVIGDTPYDIACAQAIGARALGVATGSHSVDQLRAAGADIAVPDLSDTTYVLSLLR